jgi:ATP-dependent DNA helicase RecG
LRPWLGRLQELGLVSSAGRTKATRYFVAPDVARKLDMPVTTTLGRIEQHRLEALVVEDLKRYPRSKIGKIQERIGAEISRHKIKEALDTLHAAGKVGREGERKARIYWLAG